MSGARDDPLGVPDAIRAHLESRRADPEFRRRIRDRIEADREILRRLDRPDPAGRPRCVLCGRNGYLHGPEFNPLSGEGLLVDGATGLRCAVVVSCAARVGENRRLAAPLHAARDDFLAASVAVWREIDRLDAEPEGYHPVRMSVDLRKTERAAWERYRDLLPPETP